MGIKIGRARFEPVFTVKAWIELEEKFGSLEKAIEEIKGKKTWISATAEMIAILCNQGIIREGKAGILTAEDVAERMRPRQIIEARNACLAAIAEGSTVEHEEDEEDEPIDVVLAEIQKKREAGKRTEGG